MIIRPSSAFSMPLTALAALVLTVVSTPPAYPAFGPTTPTFVLKWGNTGSAAGQMNGPWSISTDALGNVYVADHDNHRIQKFDRLGNFIAQWGSLGAGNGQFNNPTYVAIAPGGDFYVSDVSNHRIQRFTSAGAYVSQWGSFGTGNGQFRDPLGMAVDAAGNVYVADSQNNRIQKFSGTGTYLAQWGSGGTGNGQFSGPEAIALSPAGDVYVSDYFNNRVQKFSRTGAYLTQWGTPGSGDGQFNGPGGVGVDAAGSVYVGDYFNNRVQKFASDGTYLTQWGSPGAGDGQFTGAFGLAVDAAGNVYVTEYDANRIQKFSGAGAMGPLASYVLQWGSLGTGNGQFNSPQGIATDAAGNVYVAESSVLDRVQKFTANGAYLSKWGLFEGSNYVAIAANSVYVTRDFGWTQLDAFDYFNAGTGNGQFQYARGIATDGAGNIFIADRDNHRIQKFTGAPAYVSQWGSSGGGNGQFNSPEGVATDAAGNVYVADRLNNRVQKFTNGGVYVTQWGGLSSPSGVAIDPTGDVYVAEQGNHRIRKFTSAGTYLGQWGSLGSGNGQFDSPAGIAVDAAGKVYVADSGNNRIQVFASTLHVPTIALVSDIGNDQGKQAQLRVLRSSADSPGAGVTITGYEVYRRNDPLPGAAIASERAVPALVTGHDAAEPMGVQLAGWTYLGSFPAHGESEYTAVVPTLANTNGSSLYYTAFMVRAVTADPFTFYDSGVEYGYSVDNLSPPAPTQFLAAYAAGTTHLHWGVSGASDFAGFRLYRGSSEGFAPGPGNLVAATTGTDHVDPGPAGSWYKLSAVDFEGNESPFALVGPGQTTSVSGAAPLAFALEGVRPNPASGRNLSVRFALPLREPAKLELLDVAGRELVSREVGDLGPGSHAVTLTGRARLRPGLYFVRLSQGANEKVERVTVLE